LIKARPFRPGGRVSATYAAFDWRARSTTSRTAVTTRAGSSNWIQWPLLAATRCQPCNERRANSRCFASVSGADRRSRRRPAARLPGTSHDSRRGARTRERRVAGTRHMQLLALDVDHHAGWRIPARAASSADELIDVAGSKKDRDYLPFIAAVDPQHRIQVDVVRDRLPDRIADGDRTRVMHPSPDACVVAVGPRPRDAGICAI
jgi:hypothetical protein